MRIPVLLSAKWCIPLSFVLHSSLFSMMVNWYTNKLGFRQTSSPRVSGVLPLEATVLVSEWQEICLLKSSSHLETYLPNTLSATLCNPVGVIVDATSFRQLCNDLHEAVTSCIVHPNFPPIDTAVLHDPAGHCLRLIKCPKLDGFDHCSAVNVWLHRLSWLQSTNVACLALGDMAVITRRVIRRGNGDLLQTPQGILMMSEETDTLASELVLPLFTWLSQIPPPEIDEHEEGTLDAEILDVALAPPSHQVKRVILPLPDTTSPTTRVIYRELYDALIESKLAATVTRLLTAGRSSHPTV